MDKLCRGPYRISSILKWVTEKMKQRGWLKKRLMTAFEWKTFFVWRVTYICVHVTQAQILPTSSKHVSPGMLFLGLGIGGLSHQSCMSLHIGTNNIVGGSINTELLDGNQGHQEETHQPQSAPKCYDKRKPPCIGGMELVSLSCNCVFISAESVGP